MKIHLSYVESGLPDVAFFKPKFLFLENIGWSLNGKFWYMYFMALWSVLRPFGIFYGHLVNVVSVWYIFSRFGMLYKEKSGRTE
jgi:hypothetical protein